ncbi:LADA_0C05402g1_1 [Lachancea dasiensis]|uniref:LADA_0C05402g1_1 n=1 Tax=Lachancea dasiensis TaxID=1072105 RepID=A0A1G4IZ57_9SACH|nr:LADA_0C05402g1_1 [Lachancea dasiensis]
MGGKILMLHGYAQSGAIFYAKTGGFRKNLAKLGYELFYPCAPNKISGADIRDMDDIASTFNTQAGTDDIYGWWLKDPNDEYRVPQNTKDFLRDYIIENGPFDGIIGFSQGAGYAGYLCTDVRGLLSLSEEEQPNFKFFVSFSGFRMAPKWFQQRYEDSPITVPSLHVLGELDTVVESSRVMWLYDSCSEKSRTLLKHPGGHFVPNGKGFVTNVTNWLQMVGNSEVTKHKQSDSNDISKDPSKPDLDDDLLDMIDGLGKV